MCVGGEVYGKSLYLLLNTAVNPKLLKKQSLLKKKKKKRIQRQPFLYQIHSFPNIGGWGAAWQRLSRQAVLWWNLNSTIY